MKSKRLPLLVFAAVAMIGGAAPSFASTPAVESVKATPAATEPDAIIKNFYTQLTGVMKQGEQLGFAGRYKKLEPVVHATFDLSLMTRMAVGSLWANATPDEQKQLISAFSDFSVANYASQFKAYDGEEFTVADTKPTTGGVIVETKLQPKDGDAVALNYLMRQDEKGAWRVVDVFLNGAISQLAARRSEFSSIAKHDGIEALVNSLGAKTKQMGPT